MCISLCFYKFIFIKILHFWGRNTNTALRFFLISLKILQISSAPMFGRKFILKPTIYQIKKKIKPWKLNIPRTAQIRQLSITSIKVTIVSIGYITIAFSWTAPKWTTANITSMTEVMVTLEWKKKKILITFVDH